MSEGAGSEHENHQGKIEENFGGRVPEKGGRT